MILLVLFIVRIKNSHRSLKLFNGHSLQRYTNSHQKQIRHQLNLFIANTYYSLQSIIATIPTVYILLFYPYENSHPLTSICRKIRLPLQLPLLIYLELRRHSKSDRGYPL